MSNQVDGNLAVKETATVRSASVSLKTKLFYGIGQMGDSIPYNVFYIYFLYFLTDIAGVNPAVAGVVSLIAVLWDAITDPIIGHFSDNLKSKYGRRRPVMLISAIPLGLALFMLFRTVGVAGSAKNAYYIITSMVFWTAYTAYVIPYFALGAEITQDFDERNSLRSYASVFMYGAVLIASAGPMVIVGKVVEGGGTAQEGWAMVGQVFAVTVVLIIMTCWRNTKGTELELTETEADGVNIFKTYAETLKNRPYRIIVASVFLYALGFAIASGSFIYLMSYNMGLDEGTQSMFWVAVSVFSAIWLPLINWMSNKYDKKVVYISMLSLLAATSFLFYFIGFASFTMLLVFTLFFAAGNSTFWTISYSMIYDCSEVDEFKFGKRREGAITSLVSFFQKAGSAVGMWLIGIILATTGYNAELMEQTARATRGILSLSTLIPGIVIIVSALIVVKYPLNRSRFKALQTAIEAKKNGENYTTEGFEEVL